MVQLRQRLLTARQASDAVFATVASPCLYERPVPERHRLIFYLGHLDAFDWNHIARWALDVQSFHPTFDRVFEAGIDPEVGRGPSDRPEDWPDVQEVIGYVRQCRAR